MGACLNWVVTDAFLCMLGIWHPFQICHCLSRDLAHLFPSPSFLLLHWVASRIIFSLRKSLAYPYNGWIWVDRSFLLSSQHGCCVCPEKWGDHLLFRPEGVSDLFKSLRNLCLRRATVVVPVIPLSKDQQTLPTLLPVHWLRLLEPQMVPRPPYCQRPNSQLT